MYIYLFIYLYNHKLFKGTHTIYFKMETNNADITKPQSWGSKLTTVNIEMDLHNLCKKNNISLRDAMEFGIGFKLADQTDGMDYDYPITNLQNKLFKIIKHRNALLQEVDALKKQVDGVEDVEDVKEEMDKVFDAIKPTEEKKDE